MMQSADITVDGEVVVTGERQWYPKPKQRWHFKVDIVGGCNLRCPSCPVGNTPEVRNATGFMKPELLEQIVRKAKDECGRVKFHLYNWTEPFLHPDLAGMIRTVRAQGVFCGLSTNLNLLRDVDAVMRANPEEIKVSLSGFRQEQYGVTHEKGDIEVVKANMAELARARRRNRATTRIDVPFHRYLGNHEDEALMKDYARSLGFDFDPAWAYIMPLEKLLAIAEPEASDTTLTDEDRALIERLALPPDKAIEVCREAPHQSCGLRDREMTLDCRGNVQLCCGVFDQEKYGLGPYLDQALEQLQELKYRHWQCESCMRNGLHILGSYGTAELDRIALENVARHHPDAKLTGMNEELRGFARLGMRIRRQYRRTLSQLRR